MSRSNILDDFFKIAKEKGIISENNSEKSKKKLEKEHRADSLSIKDIEKLYDVKPNAPKGSEYIRNIIERAHPDSIVIAPSYDKLNGLVENNNERQDIILNILDKNPNGQLTNHKYAEKELILSLVRLGNNLDNQNNDKLRTLADTCLFQVSLKKEAIGPLAGLLGVGAILGSLYLQQHLSFFNEGFEKNHQNLISEIDDLLQSNSSFGVGYDYKSDFKNMVQDLKSKLISFYTLYKKVEPIISGLEKPRTAQELLALSKMPETDSVIKAYSTIEAAANNMLPYITTVEQNFKSETFKVKQIEDKGFLSSLVDKTHILHGGKGLIADDFDDVVRAIAPYKKSIADLLDMLNKAGSLQKSVQQKIQEATSERFGKDKDQKANQKSAPEKEVEDLDKSVLDFGIK